MEDTVDGACTKLGDKLRNPAADISDVLKAKFMRTFEGPESEALFGDGKGQGRYAFGLDVDFFNVNLNDDAILIPRFFLHSHSSQANLLRRQFALAPAYCTTFNS